MRDAYRGRGSTLPLRCGSALACHFRHSESFWVQRPRFISDELKGHLTRHLTNMSLAPHPPVLPVITHSI